jgi:hypothetical protein
LNAMEGGMTQDLPDFMAGIGTAPRPGLRS